MSANGLSARLSIPKPEAEAFIDSYFARYPKVLEYQQKLLETAHRTGEVHTILGRKRTLNAAAINPQSRYQARGQGEREAINYAERELQAQMLLTVHDELVFECPASEVKALAELVRAEMIGAIALNVPLKVDVAAGPNWLDVTDV
jgi:DNA polymerase-1